MTRFEIMTDSCCDLPHEYLNQHNIKYVSMLINLNNQEYVDDLGNTFDYEWFLTEIKKGKMPKTSQINIGSYLEVFTQFIDSSVPLIYLCFSSGLSGSYNNAKMALEQLKEEHPSLPITIVDTRAASLGEGLLVTEVVRLREESRSLEEVMAWLADFKMKVHSWVTVDDLAHLERGGRISKTAAKVGSLVKIKPIIIINSAGKLINIGKVRGRKKSLDRLVNETAEGLVEDVPQTLLVAYAGDRSGGNYVKERLLEKYGIKDVQVMPIGPTITSHTGFGAVAVFSFGKER